MIRGDKTIVSYQINTYGDLEIICRYSPFAVPLPDTVEKEIYKCVDGKICLVKTIRGTLIPKQIKPEIMEFPED